jgi:hypothetical protein
VAQHGVSERFACRVLGQPRATQRKEPRTADDEAALTQDIIALAREYGRYGYRRITALLRDELLHGEIFYTLQEAATASHVEGRGAGHTKTKPATTQLTTLDVDYRSGACQFNKHLAASPYR